MVSHFKKTQMLFSPSQSRIYIQQGGYVFIVVCVFVSNFVQKWICMKFSGKVGNGPMNKRLNFGGNPDNHLDTSIVCRIRHY